MVRPRLERLVVLDLAHPSSDWLEICLELERWPQRPALAAYTLFADESSPLPPPWRASRRSSRNRARDHAIFAMRLAGDPPAPGDAGEWSPVRGSS